MYVYTCVAVLSVRLFYPQRVNVNAQIAIINDTGLTEYYSSPIFFSFKTVSNLLPVKV